MNGMQNRLGPDSMVASSAHGSGTMVERSPPLNSLEPDGHPFINMLVSSCFNWMTLKSIHEKKTGWKSPFPSIQLKLVGFRIPGPTRN